MQFIPNRKEPLPKGRLWQRYKPLILPGSTINRRGLWGAE